VVDVIDNCRLSGGNLELADSFKLSPHSNVVMPSVYQYQWIAHGSDEFTHWEDYEFDLFPELRYLFADHPRESFRFLTCGTSKHGVIHVSRLSFPTERRLSFFVENLINSDQGVSQEDLTRQHGALSKCFSIESQFKIGAKTPSAAHVSYWAIMKYALLNQTEGVFFHANSLTEKSLKRCNMDIVPILLDEELATPGIAGFDRNYRPAAAAPRESSLALSLDDVAEEVFESG